MHLYVYFPNRMTNVLYFTSLHACYMCLLISCQSSSYSFLRCLRPRPLYPQLLFSRRLVGSRPGLDALKRKCTAPFLTSNHGPSLPTELSRLHISDLLVKKYFPRCVFLRHLLTPVRHLPHKCSLFTVFMFLVHIPQTLRHRHAEHQSVSRLCLQSSFLREPSLSHAHFARPFCSAWVQCSSGETTGKHLAPTLSRLGLPIGSREKQ